MEVRVNPVSTKLRRMQEEVADPRTGDPVITEVVEITFMEPNMNLCTVRYSAETWGFILKYLNDPETVEAEQRAQHEARSRLIVPGIEI